MQSKIEQKIIGFAGVVGSGKTSCVKCLLGELGKRRGYYPDYCVTTYGSLYEQRDNVPSFSIDDSWFVGIQAKQYNFADTLKDVLKLLFGVTDEQLYHNKQDRIDIKFEDIVHLLSYKSQVQLRDEIAAGEYLTVRDLLEYFGTGIIRSIDNDIFCKRLKERIVREKQKYVLIGDVRFANEVQIIQDMGGIVIFLNRGEIKHQSEQGLMDIEFDYTINSKVLTLEETFKEVIWCAEDNGFFEGIK